MANRIRPSGDWYRRKIGALSSHDDLTIGPPPGPHEFRIPKIDQAARAFGTLVRLERRNAKLTVAELAKAIDVEEGELRSIEHDPRYRARPRTILSIARHFRLPPKEVMKLAGAAAANDQRFIEKAMRFAAHSDDMGALSDEEKKLLHSFVEFLRDND
jgi:DNA-binding XRE family transcriptional regulator